MRRLALTLLALLTAVPAHALTRSIMENVPATNNTIMVDTTNVRVGIATATPTMTLDVNGNAIIRGPGGLTVPYGVNFGTASLTASSGTFTAAGNAQYSVRTASGVLVGAGGVTAPYFVGASVLVTTSSVNGLLDFGVLTNAQLRTTACPANYLCRAQSVTDFDIYSSTGPGGVPGRWRNSRTGNGPH